VGGWQCHFPFFILGSQGRERSAGLARMKTGHNEARKELFSMCVCISGNAGGGLSLGQEGGR